MQFTREREAEIDADTLDARAAVQDGGTTPDLPKADDSGRRKAAGKVPTIMLKERSATQHHLSSGRNKEGNLLDYKRGEDYSDDDVHSEFSYHSYASAQDYKIALSRIGKGINAFKEEH